jgi:F-type H+-transporting ATPase subunit delta
MKGTRAAIRYAKAILDLAKDQKEENTENDDMQQFVATVAASKELQMLLDSPIIKVAQKTAALKEIFANINPITEGLVNVVAENKRLNLLAITANEYTNLFDADSGKQKAVVTTAIPLTEALNTQVLAKVKELTGKDAVLENKVDESILGGFVLRVGDLQYNASIANKLNNLKRTFSQN